MKYILEYNEDEQKFRFNYLESNGTMMNPLFLYSWRPICIISEEMATNKVKNGLSALITRLTRNGYSLEKVTDQVLRFMLNYEGD